MRAEAAHAREEPGDRLLGILQLFHVRQEAAGLDGELELRRRTAGPGGERRALGQPVEAVVDFDGIERPRVVLEPARLGQLRGIEIALPVFVLPARAPYACPAAPAAHPRRQRTRSSSSGGRAWPIPRPNPKSLFPRPWPRLRRTGERALRRASEQALGDQRVQDPVAHLAIEIEDETSLLGREREAGKGAEFVAYAHRRVARLGRRHAATRRGRPRERPRDLAHDGLRQRWLEQDAID